MDEATASIDIDTDAFVDMFADVSADIAVGVDVTVAVGIVVGVGVRSSVTTTLSLAIPGKVSMPTLGTSIATPTTTFVLAVTATRIIMPRLVWDILAVAIIGADYASIVSNVTVVDVPSICIAAITVSTIIRAADVVSNATVAMVYCCSRLQEGQQSFR